MSQRTDAPGDLLAPSAAEVYAAIDRYGENPSSFLALNQGNRYFTEPGLPGLVVYRESGRYLIQFGGPFTMPETSGELLDAFLAFAAARRRRVLGVQLQQEDVEAYSERGFRINQIGASYAVDLERFTLKGGKFMQLRNKVSRARRAGLVVEEADPAEQQEALEAIDARWLRAKGRFVKQLQFLVGEHGAPAAGSRRLFVGRLEGEVAAYITYVPVPGARGGWMHDLSRRLPEVPPGVMEAINVTAIERFQAEKAGWLHFGFTPFTGLDPALDPDCASPFAARIVRFLAAHGEHVYPAKTQLAYKEKWQPHLVLPEYLAFQGRPRLGGIWQLMRVTNSV